MWRQQDSNSHHRGSHPDRSNLQKGLGCDKRLAPYALLARAQPGLLPRGTALPAFCVNTYLIPILLHKSWSSLYVLVTLHSGVGATFPADVLCARPDRKSTRLNSSHL